MARSSKQVEARTPRTAREVDPFIAALGEACDLMIACRLNGGKATCQPMPDITPEQLSQVGRFCEQHGFAVRVNGGDGKWAKSITVEVK